MQRRIPSGSFGSSAAGLFRLVLFVSCGMAWSEPPSAYANGVQRNGIGARSMALGGTAVAHPNEPLDALAFNPAGLTLSEHSMLQLGGWGAAAQGEFANTADRNGELKNQLGFAPEGAVASRMKSVPVAIGLGVFADSAAQLDWRFVDPPGGADAITSYGPQQHRALFLAIRTSLGASVRLSETLSVGASLGLIYNQNELEAPYVFQRHPALRGLKTLLDLETDGWGIGGTIGMIYRPHPKVNVGLTYRSPTRLDTDGRASGNAGVQLANLGPPFDSVRPDFRYNAEVETGLPQAASAGVSWQFHPRLRGILQLDWINWSESFDRLDIHLTDGNNADLNAFLGTDQIDDAVPLHWRDRFVYRAGLEFSASEEWTVRAGYAYGANPVPESRHTAMSAAILEHTVTAGLEWRRGRFSVAAAYQYDLPSESEVGTSALSSGEYSQSRTELQAHWFGLTTGFRF